MRPSAAGPMLAPKFQLSSALVSVLLWRTPPTLMMFLAHACGRESWLPAFDWLCVQVMSLSNVMSSDSADVAV